jgi:hypothetical protein
MSLIDQGSSSDRRYSRASGRPRVACFKRRGACQQLQDTTGSGSCWCHAAPLACCSEQGHEMIGQTWDSEQVCSIRVLQRSRLTVAFNCREPRSGEAVNCNAWLGGFARCAFGEPSVHQTGLKELNWWLKAG